MRRDAAKAETAKGEHARRDGEPSKLPRRADPQARPRMGNALPPEAFRPFLDALAEILASWVVTRITVGPGTRTHRKLEVGSEEGFDQDSSAIRAGNEGNSIGR